MAKTINPVTLDELNANLLCRLNDLVAEADDEGIVKLTEAIAKLNSSWKGNDQFGLPESDEERIARERSSIIGQALNGETVD